MTITTTPVTPYLENFLTSRLHEWPSQLTDIFESGAAFGKKEMQISWLQAAFMQMLIKISKTKKILEIGTYVGFSASVMATALPKGGCIITCENVEAHHKKALENFRANNLTNVVIPLFGDAKDLVSQKIIASKIYDLIFLDGDKENYVYYLRNLDKNLKIGGLFIVDNTLFKGEVIGGISDYSKGIRKLVDEFKSRRDYELSHITIGDGMLVARKVSI